jgi:hypothetical protein
LNKANFRIEHARGTFELLAHQPGTGGAPHPAEGKGDILGVGFIDEGSWRCGGFFEQCRDFLAGWAAEDVASVIGEGMQGRESAKGAGNKGFGGGGGGGESHISFVFAYYVTRDV